MDQGNRTLYRGSPIRLLRTAQPIDRTRLRVWRPLTLERADLVCEEITAREIRLHAHEELQVLLPLAPFRTVDGAGRFELAGSGSIALTNPAELHGALPVGSEPWSARVMLVPTERLARALGDLPTKQDALWFSRRVVKDDLLAGELHALFDQLRRPSDALANEARLMACLARLLVRHAEIQRPLPPTPRHRWAAHRVREYLRVNVARSVSVDELARVGGLSKYYLLRAFARELGVSPHVYQMELRLARARTLLANGVRPSHAAYQSGFADQSHLTRRMRAAFGFTPAAYARQFSAPSPVSWQRKPFVASASVPEVSTAA